MAYFRQSKVVYSHLEKVTKKRRSDMLFSQYAESEKR
jgi:hypothetical protein